MPSDPPLPVPPDRVCQANGVHTPHWQDHSHDCPGWIRRAGPYPPLTGPQSAGPQRDALRKSAKLAARGWDPAAATRSSKRKVRGPGIGPRTSPEPIYFGRNNPKRGRHEKSTLGGHMPEFPLRRGRNINRPAPQNFRRENRHFCSQQLDILPASSTSSDESKFSK